MKPVETTNGHAVNVHNLTRTFGKLQALHQVTLDVPRGIVYGLVGENGAGKTTLIRHLLGLYKAESGAVKVFGFDPALDPVAVLSRIGYLSEDRDLPDWMHVHEVIRYTSAFYPNWDHAHAEEMRKRFELDPKARTGSLSRGQRARLGLLLAQAHRPDLLLLDEPSSGLDPGARRDILEAVIRAAADEGRTVILSSHLLDEVERVCDRLAMIVGGKVALEGTTDDIKSAHQSCTVWFPHSTSNAPPIINGQVATGTGGGSGEWNYIIDSTSESFNAALQEHGSKIVDSRSATLDEILMSRAATARANKEALS